jgi:phosphoribosylanthranilate isomerase
MFIKICGITSVADARMVADSGANAIGLNFFPDSPRFVLPSLAHEIIQSLPPFVEPVGLFVNMPVADIRQLAQSLNLRTLQLHGNVTPQTVTDLKDFSVIPSFPLRDAASVSVVLEFIAGSRHAGRLPNAILVDAFDDRKLGGTGRTAPWSIAREVVAQSQVPIILAGGLTARNVGDAVRVVGSWGIDVASGVEVAPGRKEPYKVRSFIDAARRAVIQSRGR